MGYISHIHLLFPTHFFLRSPWPRRQAVTTRRLNSAAAQRGPLGREKVTMGQRSSRTWESAKFEIMGKPIEIMIHWEKP